MSESPKHKDPQAEVKPAAAEEKKAEEPKKEEPKKEEAPHPSGLNAQERFDLIRGVGEECIMDEELRKMVANKPFIRCYDGFEPSGRMHIAQGIFKAVNVNKCTKVGCEFVFWVADWFALMNDKMGGELDRIKTVGEYLVEVWRAAGMDMEKVKFLWSSDEINTHADEYWKIVLDVARRNSIARVKKCCTIMGKSEGNLSSAQILYPLMQCADIFFLKADICQLGKDQRKVNMLAREYCDLIGKKLKPVILSHHMLSGLKKGQAKMSKSDPDSAIFMEDTAEDVERKIMNAYCPRVAQKAVETGAEDSGLPDADDEKNPVLDYIECIILSSPGSEMTVKTADKDDHVFTSYSELEKAFLDNKVTEEDLKKALIVAINKLLDPVRDHFKSGKPQELLETIKGYKGLEPPVHKPKPSPTTPNAIVFVPASIKLPIGEAEQIVAGVNSFLEKNADAKVQVILPDWSAFARNEVTGDHKEIGAVLEYNAKFLQSLGLNTKAEVVKQSAFILKNPNDYWVTAIGVGRKRNLDSVTKAIGTIETAGQVVATLMSTADAVLLDATHVIATDATEGLANFIEDFTEARTKAVAKAPLSLPVLCKPTEKPTGANDILHCDDNDMILRSKIKKAYCAENETENPIVEMLAFFLPREGTIEVERKDKEKLVLKTSEELLGAAKSGELHPGDAKTALTALLMKYTEKSRASLKTPEVKKLATVVATATKKLEKASKKK